MATGDLSNSQMVWPGLPAAVLLIKAGQPRTSTLVSATAMQLHASILLELLLRCISHHCERAFRALAGASIFDLLAKEVQGDLS